MRFFHFPNTLAARLTFWYAAIFVLFSGIAFTIFYFVVQSVLDTHLQNELIEDVEEFHHLLVTEGKAQLFTELEREILVEDPDTVFIRLLDPSGNAIFSTGLGAWNQLELNRLATQSNEVVVSRIKMAEDDDSAYTASGPVGEGFQIQIGESLEENEDFMELLVNIFAATFPVLILLGALAGWFMAKRALQGVEEVSRAAIDVAQGRLDRRVEVNAQGEEIQRLVDTFNTMVDRLRALITGMRGMTDNIAHDLRSPLARIRAGAEQALSSAKSVDDHQKSAVNTLEECDRLLHMINTTLDVAETEAGVVHLEKKETDISQIVLDACELYEALAEDKGIAITHQIESNCKIEGNTSYLQRMLGNLLDNALKYTRPKGKVDVRLEKNDGEIYIKVADTGVGINTAEQSRVFDRFFRCDTSRSEPGCGLGLSLAKAIAKAHGGEITFVSKPDSGSIFTISLPY